jgi:hypothetical protein
VLVPDDAAEETMMTGWHKIEAGWYEHESGATVQYWRVSPRLEDKSGWYAWATNASNADYTAYKTMREAMAAAVKGGKR